MSRSEDRRFPLLTEATMTPRQRESYQKIVSGPRKGASGPFNALLRSPEVLSRARAICTRLRSPSLSVPNVRFARRSMRSWASSSAARSWSSSSYSSRHRPTTA